MKSIDQIRKLYSELPEDEKARFRHELNTEGIYQDVPEYSEDMPGTRFSTLTEIWGDIVTAKKNKDHQEERKLTYEFFRYWRSEPSSYLTHLFFKGHFLKVSELEEMEKYIIEKTDQVKKDFLNWLHESRNKLLNEIIEINQNSMDEILYRMNIRDVADNLGMSIEQAEEHLEFLKKAEKRSKNWTLASIADDGRNRVIDLNLGDKDKQKKLTNKKDFNILNSFQNRLKHIINIVYKVQDVIEVANKVIGFSEFIFDFKIEVIYILLFDELPKTINTQFITSKEKEIQEYIKTKIREMSFNTPLGIKESQAILNELGEKYPDNSTYLKNILFPFVKPSISLSGLTKKIRLEKK